MKKMTRVSLLCLALMMLIASAAAAAAGVNDGNSFASEVAYNVNAQRAAIGVGSLRLDSTLNECARILAREMEGLKGDEALRPNGKNWTTVLDEQGYFIDSNLAARNRYTSKTAPDSTTLVQHWMTTGGLQANTLYASYTHTGVYGFYSETHDTYYVVQLFAKPATVEPAGYVAVANTDQLVYEGPSTTRPVIWMLARGARVTVQATVGSWARFAVSGSYGYVPLSSLSRWIDTAPAPTPTPTQPPGYSGSTYYASANVNVRSGPGTQYSVVGSLSSGQAVTVTGSSGNWYRINWSLGSAYVSASYLSQGGTYYPQPTPTTASDGNFYATSRVNVRSGPSTGYSIVGTLEANDRVTVTATNGNWYRINWNNGSAYVSASYLARIGSAVPTEPPASSGSTYYATANVNVRSGPSTRYSVVGGLTSGQRVTVVGSSGNWYRISWNNGSAYVSASYLRQGAASTPSTPSTGTIGQATANVNVRSGPSTSYKRLGTLYKGELVTIKGYEGSWARVEWGGYASAYISRSYLTAVR